PPVTLPFVSFLLPRSPEHCPTLFPYTTLFRSFYYVSFCAFVLLLQLFVRPRWWLALLAGAMTGLAHLTKASVQGQPPTWPNEQRSEEHTSELQSRRDLVCRLLLATKNNRKYRA